MERDRSREVRVEKDFLLAPEVMVHDFHSAPSVYMKPAFDVVWNACGYPESMLEKWGVRR